MNKILIATKNRDKFVIAADIFKRIGLQNYEFVNLHDLGIVDEIEEIGSISQRAEQKAEFYGEIAIKLPVTGLAVVIGIDDGIRLTNSDEASPNSKEITEGILLGKLHKKGDTIWIARSFSVYVRGDKSIVTTETQIPFIFLGNDNKIRLKNEQYPLSFVFSMMNDFRPVAEVSSKESNDYYLKYSESPLREMFLKAGIL